MRWLLVVAAAMLVLLVASPAAAADPVREDVAIHSGQISAPTAMALAPDGRMFVVEQYGRVRVIENGVLLPTPFVTIPVTPDNERGLLGIAFDPNFASNRWIYFYYSATTNPVVNRLSRFTASPTNPNVAAAGSEEIILGDIPSEQSWHNGGAIHFGPDGKLYVAVGEGHTGSNAQSMSTLAGKLLRIDADGTIPPDNPFYGTAGGVNRAIWSLGLRNPFTFDIQAATGRIFVNDVGGRDFEEINEAWSGPNTGANAGFNFGWPSTWGPTTDPDFKSPFHHYLRTATDCAITGGAFYDPPVVNFPAEYADDYFFADYCAGWIKSIDVASKQVTTFLEPDGTREIVDVDVGPDGSLYYLGRGPENVRRVRYVDSATPPAIVTHPQDRTVHEGEDATFTAAATGSAPLSFRWQRDGADIPGATGASYTLRGAQLSDDGAAFRAVVTNSLGTATSDPATLTVTPPDEPPSAAIDSPEEGSLYTAGTMVDYAGTGTDPEDGELGGAFFTWRVDFHHADHVHPAEPPTSGSTGGQLEIPVTGHTDADVWYRIHLTVRDSSGQTSSVHRDVLPRTSQVTLATNVAGLALELDDSPVTPPHTHTGVVGMQRELSAPSPQTVGDKTYEFISWSDGGAATHTISTPLTDTTYTATYREVPPAIVEQPQDRTIHEGDDGTFSVTASGSAPLSYQWQRDGVDIAGATSSSYTLADAQPGDDGARFRVVVTNAAGSATSNAAMLTVTPEQSPSATITTPSAGTLYSAGTTVNYAGTGTDPEDGTLDASRFIWRVDFHHADHVHAFVPDTSGSKTGQFTIPATGHTATDVWYRIVLIVRDSAGRTHSTHRDVQPRTAQVTLATNVAGMALELDDSPVAPPHTHTGVVGIQRKIEAPSPQTVGGKTYEFVSWSDGGAATHTISTPATDTTFTATYRQVPPSIVTHPEDLTVRGGEDASFSVAATGSPPLSYQWQRDGIDIPGATGASYTVTGAQLGDNGAQFRAIVTNGGGSAASSAATLSVTESQPPTAVITAPAEGTLYSAGETIAFEGTGTDPEDGTLDGSRFTWRVDYHHPDGVTTVVPATSGSKTGQFTIPTSGPTPADSYRIRLAVRDSVGLTDPAQRDILPRTSEVTLATNIAGLALALDDAPVAAPHTHTGVAGIQRKLSAPSPQTVGGKTYEFVAWSDGGGATHTIATPASDTIYTATYQEVAAPPPPGLPAPPAPPPEITGPPDPLAVVLDAPRRFTWRAARRRGIPIDVKAPSGTLVLIQLRLNGRVLASRLVTVGSLGARLVKLHVRPLPARPTRRLRITASAIAADGRFDAASRRIVLSRRR